MWPEKVFYRLNQKIKTAEKSDGLIFFATTLFVPSLTEYQRISFTNF